MLSPLQYFALLILVAMYAFARGKIDERAAASICVIATVATMVVASPVSRGFAKVESGVLVVDLVALAAFSAIALRSDRFWPLWVAGFQLTSTIAHGLKAVHVGLLPQAYAVAERFWVYPIFLVIVVGTWRSHRRRSQQGASYTNAHPV
nr:hypothetical protein [uncultured Sphingomonas sp.]